MGNYHYIITGLPDLVPDPDGKTFSYGESRDSVYGLCDEEDRQLIEFLESGFQENGLNGDFYLAAELSDNRFIRQYFSFDREFRNLRVLHIVESVTKDPEKYLIGSADPYFEEKDKILAVLNGNNIIEKERQLDRIIWDKVEEITAFDYFSVEKILAFLVKARITDRWRRMDKEKGAGLFGQLVNEVRGTFEGVREF